MNAQSASLVSMLSPQPTGKSQSSTAARQSGDKFSDHLSRQAEQTRRTETRQAETRQAETRREEKRQTEKAQEQRQSEQAQADERVKASKAEATADTDHRSESDNSIAQQPGWRAEEQRAMNPASTEESGEVSEELSELVANTSLASDSVITEDVNWSLVAGLLPGTEASEFDTHAMAAVTTLQVGDLPAVGWTMVDGTGGPGLPVEVAARLTAGDTRISSKSGFLAEAGSQGRLTATAVQAAAMGLQEVSAHAEASLDPELPGSLARQADFQPLTLGGRTASTDAFAELLNQMETLDQQATAGRGVGQADSALSSSQRSELRPAITQPSTQFQLPSLTKGAADQTQWQNAVSERVAVMASQRIQSAEIQLDPPELGQLQVRVTLNQEQASVSFASQHAVVREALDQTAFRLREMFEADGMTLVDVDVSEHSFQQQSGERQAEGQNSGAQTGTEMLSDEVDDGELMVMRSTSLIDHFV